MAHGSQSGMGLFHLPEAVAVFAGSSVDASPQVRLYVISFLSMVNTLAAEGDATSILPSERHDERTANA